MAEDEVLTEVEAVEAVYGDDCIVLEKYPPHLHVHIKPRTADDSSQQFVEAVLAIHAGPLYPKEPPHVDIIDSKGLDDNRQKHLISCISSKASELSSCLMLVALCEEAVERLSNMNHPDGHCSLCLYPMVEEPFMKLMSCFHCFHCECIIRWWNWSKMQKDTSPNNSSESTVHRNVYMGSQKGIGGSNCPVCRKVFHTTDIGHVLNLVESHSQPTSSESEVYDDEKILQSNSENTRRQKFESILKIQEENSGLIEVKKNEVLQPGVFLQRTVTSPSTLLDKETPEQHRDPTPKENSEQHRDPMPNSQQNSSVSSKGPGTSRNRNSGLRRHNNNNNNNNNARNSRKQVKQWIKKESEAGNR